MMEPNIFNKKFIQLLGFLGLLAVLKILKIIYFPFDLHSEEAQYWVWSNHLQLSYYSKPPMIAYLNWFSTSLLGDTVLGIRINSVIFSFLISVISYWLALELFRNQKTAILTALITNIFPFLISISIYFSTDAPLLFFWLCAMLFYWKAQITRKPVYWIAFGISIGLGALSKYSIFLIFIPLWMYSWQFQREVFKNKYFYLSILLALILFSPVIYWNIMQKGVGFLHLAHLAGSQQPTHTVGKALTNVLVFGIGQWAILLPFYQYPEIFRKFRQKTLSREEYYLILPAIITFLIFVVVSMMRNSEAYINWTIYAYTGIPVLFVHLLVAANKLKQFYISAVLLLTGLLLMILITSPENTTVPLGKQNPLNKMLGWSELAQKVDRLKAELPADSSYVFSTNYHISSELWFYLKDRPETYVLNNHSRMTQFDLWPGIEQYAATNRTAIFVDYNKIPPEVKNGFQTILKEDSCKIFSQGTCVETFYIYLLKGQKGFQKVHSSF